jgi:hypothetical protein
MKKVSFKNLFIVATALALIITGCKKDKETVPDPEEPANETEVMTTFLLTFADSANSSSIITATFRDPDGDGGKPAVQFDSIKLAANRTYFASVLILDETKSPTDTTSNEIEEEANDHLFFYTPQGVNETITILDKDTHTPAPLPVGLQTKWKTGAASTGSTKIVLRHQPGVKDGTYAPGETDIEILFQTKIK